MNSGVGMSRPVITLLTDFGQTDGYVAAMKGVILSICPLATLVDISHEISPHAVRQAAYVISTVTHYFPKGSVHVIVVDPEVGTARRPVVVRTDRATFVAPDNGVLTLALAKTPPQVAVHLTEPMYHMSPACPTFHGRDVFAPVAAHLAAGVQPNKMGDPLPVSELVTLSWSKTTRQGDGSWLGEVLHIDRFGNLVTNIPCQLDGAGCTIAESQESLQSADISVTIAGTKIQGLSRTFADVRPQELVAYVGSSGLLEIGIREGNASARLGLGLSEPIRVSPTVPPVTRRSA